MGYCPLLENIINKVFLKPFWACFSSFENCLLAKNQKVLHICCSYYLDISNIPNRFPETLFNILVSTLIVFLCLENFVGVFGSFQGNREQSDNYFDRVFMWFLLKYEGTAISRTKRWEPCDVYLRIIYRMI